MISRLTASAALFAAIATAGIAYAADIHQERIAAAPAAFASAAPEVVTLPRVTVIGHRNAR